MPRKATIERKTKETDIKMFLNLDGTGMYSIKCGVPFMDHMFSHIAKHGFFDLSVRAKGDTHIDDHHTVEDLGIAFGQVLKKALGDSKGIRRYGEATVPMDETLAEVVMDLSGRPYLVYNVEPAEEVQAQKTIGDTDSPELIDIEKPEQGLELHVG